MSFKGAPKEGYVVVQIQPRKIGGLRITFDPLHEGELNLRRLFGGYRAPQFIDYLLWHSIGTYLQVDVDDFEGSVGDILTTNQVQQTGAVEYAPWSGPELKNKR